MTRMKDFTITLTGRLTDAGVAFAEEVEWEHRVRWLYGDDAARILARADDLSLTTAINRQQARLAAEDEMREVYAERLRSLADPSGFEALLAL